MGKILPNRDVLCITLKLHLMVAYPCTGIIPKCTLIWNDSPSRFLGMCQIDLFENYSY